MLIYLPHMSSVAETPEAEKMDTDTDSQQADKVKPTFKYHLLHVRKHSLISDCVSLLRKKLFPFCEQTSHYYLLLYMNTNSTLFLSHFLC